MVEKAAEEEEIRPQSQEAGRGQGVEGLVVSAIGQGRPGLVVGQSRRVVGDEGHQHGLRPIANQGPQRIDPHQINDRLPDQDPHLARARLRLEDLPQAPDVGHLLDGR